MTEPTVNDPSTSTQESGASHPDLAAFDALRAAVATKVLGQDDAIEQLLVAYLAGGHCLLEGVPGIGKTRLARSFSEALGLGLRRVQFTPDLMPADITGSSVLDPASNDFVLMKGPLFTDLLLADEINRTPPKTQAALLEAMQERQVSIDGETHALDPAFFVVATQNPIDFEGTYPLPEAQADRFLLRVEMSLPDASEELRLYHLALKSDLLGMADQPLSAVLAPEQARALRSAARETYVSTPVLEYLQGLAVAVRTSPEVELGPSPRAALALLRAAQAQAIVAGRTFVLPDDLQTLLGPCWGHRIRLRAEAELEGVTHDGLLDSVRSAVEVPRRVGPDPGVGHGLDRGADQGAAQAPAPSPDSTAAESSQD